MSNEEFSELDQINLTHSDQYKEKYFLNKFNRFDLMGTVRVFKKYRNTFDGHGLNTESRSVDLSKVKLSNIIKKEQDKPYDYHNCLPLPINKVSKIIGVAKNFKRRFNYSPNYEHAVGVEEILCKNSESFSDSRRDKISMVLPGAWRFSSINLVDKIGRAHV